MALDDDAPAGRTLQRDQFGLHHLADGDGVTFNISTGSMIRLLRQSGFEIEDLIEVRPPENASSAFDYVDLDWARRWPSEEVWKARRTTEQAHDG